VKSMTWMSWVMAMSVASAVTVSAQSQAQEESGRALGGSVTVGGVSTDNRDSAADGAEESNVDLFVQPIAELNLQGDSTALELLLGPRYRYRSDPSAIQNEDELHLDSRINFSHRFSEQTSVRLRDQFNYTDDPEVEAGNAVLRRDSSYLMNRAMAGLNHKITQTLAVDVQVNHMLKRYDDSATAARSDEDRLHAGLILSRELNQTLSALLLVGAERTDSENDLGLDRGFDTAYAALGINKSLTQKTAFSLIAGAQGAEYEDDDLDSQVSPYLRASVKSEISRTLVFNAQASHQISQAYSYPFSSQNHTSIFGKMDWQAMSRLQLGLFLEYRIEDYDSDSVSESAPASAFLADRSGEEITLLGRASATVKLADRTKVTLAHLIEDVDSDVFVSFTRNATSLTLTQEF
jgi:opacity protein-like surface antigen